MARITYELAWVFCFWNALFFLRNSARVSIPAFVLKSVAGWQSGAPLVIIARCSSYVGILRHCLEFFVAWAGDGFLGVVCLVIFPKVPMHIHACITTPSMC